MKTSLTFEFSDWQSIAFDLDVAADTYSTDAHAADRANNPRLSEQFRRQAKTSRDRAKQIRKMVESNVSL